jgi:hypothetical protein
MGIASTLTIMTSTIVNRPTTERAARARAKAEIRDLSELIAALDRRVPCIERRGETSIARAAATLKSEASRRIAVLAQQGLQ